MLVKTEAHSMRIECPVSMTTDHIRREVRIGDR